MKWEEWKQLWKQTKFALCLCILMAARKQILEQNPGTQTQLQTDLKKFQDVYNPALRSASFHWLTSLSKSGELAVFRCISLSANPLPHVKIQASQAAMLFKSEYQPQVEKHCPSKTSVNQMVGVFFPSLGSLLHLHDTTFPWSHMKQLPWFWCLLQDFPLTGREDAEFALTDSEQQQEATKKHFFHSEDGQT